MAGKIERQELGTNLNTELDTIGKNTDLTTTAKNTLVAAINENKGKIDTNTGSIGTLSGLYTTAKTNLVGAVNELDGDIGNLSTLTTTAKANLVSAINEHDGELGAISGLKTTAKNNIVGAINENYDKIGILSKNIFYAESYPIVAPETDDTARIGRLINAADSAGAGKIIFAPGTVYNVSSTIDLTSKLHNCEIIGYGATIKAASTTTFPIILMSDGGSAEKCRLVKILGLTLDGNYKADGIHIHSAQEWSIFNVQFNNCQIGLQLSDTYYGVIGQECIFYQCMTGIDFYTATTGEVNAIGIENIKFYGFNTSTKQLFIPKNAGETDADYNLRVVSKAIKFRCLVLGIDFYKCTFEFYDYAFYGFDINYGYVVAPFFNITQCYFERTIISPIYMDNINTVVQPVCKITRCVTQTSGGMVLTTGQWSYLDNDNTRPVTITLNSSKATGSVCRLVTDIPRDWITNSLTLPQTVIQQRNIPLTMNGYAYNTYANGTTSYPSKDNLIPTLEDSDYQEVIGLMTNSLVKNKYVKQSFNKPLAFTSKKSAPIIRGDDGNLYALTTANGSSVALKKVTNYKVFETPSNYLYAKELYLRTDWTEGRQMGCIETGELYTYKSGKWTNNLSGTDYTVIGKGTDLLTVPLAYNGSRKAWNVQTDSGYGSEGTYWGYSDLWGNYTNIRSLGTLAQRPANPGIDGFIYYETDTAAYSVWSVSNSAWSAYTPLF